MSPSQEESKPRRRWPKWLSTTALVAIPVLAAIVLALPWIVELPVIQRRLATAATRVLAPGGASFDHVRVSWTRPIEIDNLVLRDAQGDKIVAAPSARLSCNLRQLIVGRPDPITLTLDHASVDIERSAEGKVDLLETLKPILKDEPDRTILVRIVDGKLRFRAAGLSEPFVAEKANIGLDLTAYPQPLAWRMRLEQPGPDGTPGTLEIQGQAGRKKDKSGSPEDLELAITGNRWAWTVTRPDLHAQGGFGGTINVHESAGRLALDGDAALLNLHATGSALSGDELVLDKVGIVATLSREGETWTAERLDLSSPVGTAAASGSYPPAGDREAHLEAKLNLPELARQVPRTLRLREDLRLDKGALEIRADVTGDVAGNGAGAEAATGQSIQATARLTDLEARQGDRVISFRDPATFVAKIHRAADSFSLEQLDVQTPFLTATGRGELDRGIDVSGTTDLGAATQRLRDWVDMGKVELAGKGTFNAHYQRTAGRYEATAKAELTGLSASGLPAIDSFRRDREWVTLNVKGDAAPSGIPAKLRELSLTGRGDGEELAAAATLDEASGVTSGSLRARSDLVINGKKQTAEASVQARWNETEITLDPIVATLEPVVGPGGQFLPSAPARWAGKGRYDVVRDELTVNADAAPEGGKALPFAVAPSRLRVSGLKKREAAAAEVELVGDLARLKLPLGEKVIPLSGTLEGLIQTRQQPDGWELGARMQVKDLAQVDEKGGRQVLAETVAASLRGRLAGTRDRFDVAEVAVITPYGKINGAGPITDLKTSPRFDLKGMFSPEWKVLSDLLAKKVEPNASIGGSSREWRLAGTIPKSGGGDLLASLNGEFGLNLEHLDIFGMRLGETPLVVRADKGKIQIDTIDTTLNSGRLHLEPEVITDKQGLSWVHLGATSRLMDAVVNDEVSHRVLSFAAPVLDQATRVRGRVSLALTDAYFPLGAGPDAQPKVDGDVLFDAVEFMPGPLADRIIGVFRQERRPLLVLRDPVSVRIVGRTIYQEGLIIPLGKLAAIGIEGTVDFDQNLNLVASFAMAPPQKEIPVLSRILENTQIQLPITGTFKKPKLDGDAVAERFKDMGVNMLDTVIGAGVNGLGRVLQRRPAGGRANAPPRDFFPPFVPPGGDTPLVDRRTPLPPRPGNEDRQVQPAEKRKSRDAAADKTAERPRPAANRDVDDPDDMLADPADRQTPAERRQLLREQRKERRIERREERRMRRSLPPG